VILGHPFEVAAVGFELLELVVGGIVAVRSAADVEVFVVAFQRDLSFVAGAAASGDGGMAFHALLC
jgi:hypothetical protein